MCEKLATMLTNCGMADWVPIMEAEITKGVQDFEEFQRMGEPVLREVFETLAEQLGLGERLDEEALDRFMVELYHKRRLPAPGCAPKAQLPADAAPQLSTPLCERYTWAQSPGEVYVEVAGLPPTVKARDVKVQPKPERISLTVAGECVLMNATLHAPIKADEADWDLQDAPGGQSRVLTVTLPKRDDYGAIWFALLRKHPP